jgi:SAM-dependent methyltransferase
MQNDTDRLGMFQDDSFDLIYTVLVLQHQSSRRVACTLIREFVRILKAGGLIVFQIPTYLPLKRRIQPRRRLYALLRSVGVDRQVLFERFGLAPLGLIAVPESTIENVINSAGARILQVDPGEYFLADGAESRSYWITK